MVSIWNREFDWRGQIVDGPKFVSIWSEIGTTKSSVHGYGLSSGNPNPGFLDFFYQSKKMDEKLYAYLIGDNYFLHGSGQISKIDAQVVPIPASFWLMLPSIILLIRPTRTYKAIQQAVA